MTGFFFVSLLFRSQLTPLEIFQEQTQSGSGANDPEREDDRLHEGRLKESHRSSLECFICRLFTHELQSLPPSCNVDIIIGFGN